MDKNIWAKEIKEIHEISVRGLNNLHKVTNNTIINNLKPLNIK